MAEGTGSAQNLFCEDPVPSDNYHSNCSDDKFLDKLVTNTQRRFDIDSKDAATNTRQLSVEYKIDALETHQLRPLRLI